MLLAVLVPDWAIAGPPLSREQALDAGKALGDARKGDIQDAATHPDYGAVPGYQGIDVPETGYYELGVGIEDAARQALPEHDVGRYVDDSATARPQFTIDRNDPSVLRGDTISADPERVLGTALTGEYSACEATPTTPAPATFTEARCTEWGVDREFACTKTLSVAVDRLNTCVPNQVVASTSAGRGLAGLWLRCTADKSRLQAQFQFTQWCYWDYRATTYSATLSTEATARIISPGLIDIWARARTGIDRKKLIGADYFRRGCFLSLETGGCTNDECRYTFRFVDEYNWDDSWYPDADHTLTLRAPPPERVTVTDRWDDGCATLEAKSQ
jgi:hypothetical protein